jgi:hypothetical protein
MKRIAGLVSAVALGAALLTGCGSSAPAYTLTSSSAGDGGGPVYFATVTSFLIGDGESIADDVAKNHPESVGDQIFVQCAGGKMKANGAIRASSNLLHELSGGC